MPDEAQLLRHSLRGTINALKLGVSAMDTGLDDAEAVEFLDYIIQASDKMCVLLDQYDLLPDSAKGVSVSVPSAGAGSGALAAGLGSHDARGSQGAH
jgi:hypothetical protein